MNDPQAELPDVIRELTSGNSPTIQRDVIRRVFTRDASFNHPLCRVVSSPDSRDRQLLRIYQWYRIMSPIIELNVRSVHFDEPSSVAFVQVTQTFHIFLSPLKPAPASLLVRLDLLRDPDTKHYLIASQTDFYSPEDVAFLVVPPLGWLVLWLKSLGTAASVLATIIFQWVFGWWVPGLRRAEGGEADKGTFLADARREIAQVGMERRDPGARE